VTSLNSQLIDGAALDWSFEEDLVETIPFIDRRYLGVVTARRNSPLFYASLMSRVPPDEEAIRRFGKEALAEWRPHSLNKAMTDSLAHAREIIVAAYEALDRRLGGDS
jgi:hypothetical protein